MVDADDCNKSADSSCVAETGADKLIDFYHRLDILPGGTYEPQFRKSMVAAFDEVRRETIEECIKAVTTVTSTPDGMLTTALDRLSALFTGADKGEP